MTYLIVAAMSGHVRPSVCVCVFVCVCLFACLRVCVVVRTRACTGVFVFVLVYV